jgi:predicted DNA-binding ribbon-helix-helix protein
MESKAETTPANEPASASALKFRILKRQGWKASFRLEEIFWQVLGDAARSKNIKIADYVKDAIDRAGSDSRNQSSALRVHAAEFLVARCHTLQERGEAGSSINAALAAPSPCFVLSSARKLINHNREFYDFVSAAGALVSPGGVSSALLTLDAEVPKLIDLLGSKPGNTLTCGYTLRIDARLLRGKARVALVAQNDAKLLVGYILDSATSVRPLPAA